MIFSKKHISSGHKGFSLLEILVVVTIVSLITALTISSLNFSREHAEDTLRTVERAIRYAQDQAALRNVIVRLHFYLNTQPQQFALEFGPDDNFVIPVKSIQLKSLYDLSDEDRKEIENKRQKEVNSKFRPLVEFQKENFEIPETLRIIGVGTSIQDEFVTDFDPAIYIYPNGEKDGAIVIFGSEDEVISLEIPAFTNDFKREYKTISEEDVDAREIYEIHESMAIDLVKKWQSN